MTAAGETTPTARRDARRSARGGRWRASGGTPPEIEPWDPRQASATASGRWRSRAHHFGGIGKGEVEAAAGNDADSDARRLHEETSGRGGHRRGRRFAVTIEIAIEVAGVAHEHVVLVQLVGLPAEPSDRLDAIDELRLGLRRATLGLGAGRPRFCDAGDFRGP